MTKILVPPPLLSPPFHYFGLFLGPQGSKLKTDGTVAFRISSLKFWIPTCPHFDEIFVGPPPKGGPQLGGSTAHTGHRRVDVFSCSYRRGMSPEYNNTLETPENPSKVAQNGQKRPFLAFLGVIGCVDPFFGVCQPDFKLF